MLSNTDRRRAGSLSHQPIDAHMSGTARPAVHMPALKTGEQAGGVWRIQDGLEDAAFSTKGALSVYSQYGERRWAG